MGFTLRREKFFKIAFSLSLKLKDLMDFPSSKTGNIFSKRSTSSLKLLFPFSDFLAFSNLFSTSSRSDNISSKLIVSTSLRGLTSPSTWTIFSSSKHLITSTIASTSLI